jgi:putative ABC transport system substrate-binding protein
VLHLHCRLAHHCKSFRTELHEGLRKLGYVEGQNINFDFRSAEGNINLLPELAAELVALRLDVIVALYTPCEERTLARLR